MAWRHAVLVCMARKSIMADDNRAGNGMKFRAHNTVLKPTRSTETISHFCQS